MNEIAMFVLGIFALLAIAAVMPHILGSYVLGREETEVVDDAAQQLVRETEEFLSSI